MSSLKSESFTSLLIQMPFISFCCLIVEARTSTTMLNSSGDSGHPCCVPYLRGKAKLELFTNKLCQYHLVVEKYHIYITYIHRHK